MLRLVAYRVVFVTGDKRETQSIQTYGELYASTFPVQYMHATPLYFTMKGDALTREYFSVNLSHYDKGDLPVAEVKQMHLGLFEDRKLVYWLEQEDEQPATFVGDWGAALFFRNPQEYTLDREKSYCLALVVLDEYDREVVYADIPIVYTGGEKEEDGRWHYSSDGRTSKDPADWDY